MPSSPQFSGMQVATLPGDCPGMSGLESDTVMSYVLNAYLIDTSLTSRQKNSRMPNESHPASDVGYSNRTGCIVKLSVLPPVSTHVRKAYGRQGGCGTALDDRGVV